jgi:hypothetical protein
MEAHYLTIKQWQDDHSGRAITLRDEAKVMSLCVDAVAPLFWDDHGNQTEDQQLAQWMYEGYVARYGLDRQWRILEVEHKLQQPLPNEWGEPSLYLIKARLDLIVMEYKTGGIWVIDHKSGANLPSQMDLSIDDQFGLYTWLMRQEDPAKYGRLMGTIHNAARTTRNTADFPDYVGKLKPQTLEQRMARTYLNRTDTELRNIALDAYNVAVNAYPEVEGREQLPLYSSPDPRQCGWKCDVRDAHLAARTGVNIQQVLADQGFVQDHTRH